MLGIALLFALPLLLARGLSRLARRVVRRLGLADWTVGLLGGLSLALGGVCLWIGWITGAGAVICLGVLLVLGVIAMSERAALIFATSHLALWGAVVYTLVAISSIPGVRWNEVVLVLMPFDLVLPFLGEAKRRRYAQLRIAGLMGVSVLCATGVLVQPLWVPDPRRVHAARGARVRSAAGAVRRAPRRCGRCYRGAMRSSAALAAVVVVVLASRARADAPSDPLATGPAPADPLAVLRDPSRSWTYELVKGESLAALAPAPGMPRMRCKVAPWDAPGKLARSVIECEVVAPPGQPAPPAGAATSTSLWLVFDDAGVRQVEGRDADVADRSKTRGLTFPRRLDGRWKLDEKGRDGARTQVIVREELAVHRGASRKVWVAEAQRWPPPAGGKVGEPARELVRFVPGEGPVLICSQPANLAPAHLCLRLVDDAAPAVPPPPPPAPAGRVSISSKQAHDPSTLKAGDVAAKLAAAYLGGVRRCYQVALARRPGTRGTLTLAFTVNAVGKTTAISAKGFDDEIAGCVAKQAAGWRFPIPQSTYAEPRNARFTIVLALAP